MKELTPKSLFCVALVSLSTGTFLKAQQDQVIQWNSSPTLNPAQSPSGTTPVSSEAATTVQSSTPLPQTYVPRGRVTANEYYKMLQTTGSYGVNLDRSQADQNAAISKAREMKRLKEQAASVRHYRSNFASSSEFLESVPPPSPPAPLDSPSPEAQDGDSELNGQAPVASSPASGTPPFTPVDQARVPLFQKLMGKRRQPDPGSPSAEGGNPYDGGATQLPPASLREGPDQINAPAPPSNAPVPQFAGREDEPAAGPAPKKGLFSLFRKNSASTGAPAAPRSRPGAQAPATSRPPSSSQPQSIFRSNSLAANRNRSYSITGRKVIADVRGTPVKLSQGTRVTLLRSGTSHSLIQLYDSRQATVPNEALVPDS